MTEWSAAVTAGGPGKIGALDDDVHAIYERLQLMAPSIGVSLDSVTVRIAVVADDAGAAAVRAVVEVQAAFDAVAWPCEVRDLEVTEWSTFERRLEEPAYPELVGISEVAALLDTSRQRASELARSSKFPAPHADLAAGPVWLKPTVMRFAKEWDRKPGRPRVNADPVVARGG